MKVIIAVVVVATVLSVSIVQGYDFSDSAFNALLADEYDEFMSSDDQDESPLNYRAKREAPCGSRMKELPSQRCCKEAIEKPGAFEKVRDVKKECFGQVKGNRTEFDFEYEMFSCERIQKKKEDMRCAYECIGKKQKVFGEDNQFDEKATIEYFRNEFVDLPWVKDNLESIIKGCIAEGNAPAVEVEAVKASRAADAEEQMKCSAKPMKFMFCTWREFTKKCPVEQQKDSKSCKLIREGKVEFVQHNHHHHHHE